MKDFYQDGVAAARLRHDPGFSVWAAALPLPLPAPANVNSPFLNKAGRGRNRRLARQAPPRRNWYLRHGKRVLDTVLILLSLPVSLPVIAICALALWIEGGQPFYWQVRLGQGCRKFSIVKMRTMVRDADARLADYLERDPALRSEWETTQKLKKDPRVTRVGAVLRATSLDELPQLWNVLKGEMSLVGPRPMMPEQLPLYGNPDAYFAVRPGITGMWQVSARNESRFAYRSEVDAVYYRTATIWRDLVLMVRTLGVMVRRTGC